MSIQFSCPACGVQIRAPDAASGRSGKCKKCGASITVPATQPPSPPTEGGGAPARMARSLVKRARDLYQARKDARALYTATHAPCPNCKTDNETSAFMCKQCGCPLQDERAAFLFMEKRRQEQHELEVARLHASQEAAALQRAAQQQAALRGAVRETPSQHQTVVVSPSFQQYAAVRGGSGCLAALGKLIALLVLAGVLLAVIGSGVCNSSPRSAPTKQPAAASPGPALSSARPEDKAESPAIVPAAPVGQNQKAITRTPTLTDAGGPPIAQPSRTSTHPVASRQTSRPGKTPEDPLAILTAPQRAVLRDLLAAYDEQRPRLIADTARRVAALKGSRSPDERKRANLLSRRLSILKTRSVAVWPVLSLKVGSVGVLEEADGLFEVQQVVDESTALVRRPGGTKLYMVKGNTRGLADESRINLAGVPLLVSRTETYTTVLGSTNTVLVLECIDPLVVTAYERSFPRKSGSAR